MEDDELPSKKLSFLETILLLGESKMINIKVKKYEKPILSPEMFNGKYTSIRNPGATTYNSQIFLLPTIRYSEDNKSRLHIAKSYDGINFKLEEKPFIDLDKDSLLGVEDARITKVKDEYLITFTAYKENLKEKGITTRIGFVKTKDFKTYTDRKIILDKFGNNKNCVIFQDGNPKEYYVVHRPFAGFVCDEKPGARISLTKDFENFKDLGSFLEPTKESWENARVGINTPPIKTDKGYLMFYHGASQSDNTYSMGYLLSDKKNPLNILERSKEPFMKPELDWEKKGEVNNVIFGNGPIVFPDNKIGLYYAGADSAIGFAELTIDGAKIIDKPFSINYNLS